MRRLPERQGCFLAEMYSRLRTWDYSSSKLAPSSIVPKCWTLHDNVLTQPDHGTAFAKYFAWTRWLSSPRGMGTRCLSRGWRAHLPVGAQPYSRSESPLGATLENDRPRPGLTGQASAYAWAHPGW